MSSHSSPGEGYSKALELLQQLQNTIESQQKDIAKLHAKLKSFKAQNEELRKERDELRLSNAENLSKIAELSRKNSTKPGGSPTIKRYLTSPVNFRTAESSYSQDADYAEAIVPVVTVEESPPPGIEDDEDSGHVTLRRPISRNNQSRKAVYVPTPPTPRRSRKHSQEKQEEEEEEPREEEDYDSSNTPVPPFHHLLDSERHASDMSTDLSSNEGSITSVEDGRSPTPSSAASSLPISPSPTTDMYHGLFDRPRISIGSEEEDRDEQHPLTMSMPPPMRSRLATVAHIVRRQGNKDSTDSASPSAATPLRRQNSFPRRGRQTSTREQAYLSPDMELKIQQLIQQALGKKFGGLDRANQAAITIQRAYRKYKIDSHFNMLRRMQHNTIRERRRTMSVRHQRNPSIMHKKQHHLTSASKMDEVRDKFKTVTQTRLSPSISRRELRSKPSPLTFSSEDIRAELSHVPEEDSLSLSAIEVGSLAQRSPSIFENVSSSSLHELFPANRMPRQLSTSALTRKTNIGTNIFNRKPIKGIQYLVYHDAIKDDPHEVAKFLKNHYGLSKVKIGEFVGEIRYDFNMAVLECLVQLIDLSHKTIDEAIRSFQQLFRMPGEAQKIDKVMQVFAGEYYESNKENGVIKSEDSAYVLSFAIMMLHTDLHNPSVKRHMTKKDWLRMNRGTNDDGNYPDEFLLEIYDRIAQREFATGKDHTDEVAEIKRQIVGSGCPPLINSQRRLLGQYSVQQVNDMHRRAIRRHRRVLFLFNDVLLVVKVVAANKYEYRKSFTLLNSQAMAFHTHNFKFGVFVQHELNGESYYCNCESEENKADLLGKLEDAIFELKEMEKERITEFKNASYKDGDTAEASGGDLMASKNLSSSADDLHSLSLGKDNIDFRRIANTNAAKDTMKRSSKDSGFDSPHTSSPSPNGTEIAAASSSNNFLSPTSPQKDMPPRSRTPESPRRTMKVIPGEKTGSKYLTLNPSPQRRSKDKVSVRKSMPPDAMARLREDEPIQKGTKKKTERSLSVQSQN